MRPYSLFLLAAAAVAQPAFEAADVHPAARTSNPSIQPFDSAPYAANRMKGGLVRGGLYVIRNATLVDLIGTAYSVDPDNVSGGPAWLDTDRFDIVAKPPADATPAALNGMLQSLLKDRFNLAVHAETQPKPAYALTAKRPQLKPAAVAGKTGCRAEPSDGIHSTFSCQSLTMAAFSNVLPDLASSYLGHTPVIDRTALPGAYDFTVHWTPRDRLASVGADGVSLFDALEQQLGLKLEPETVPTPVIVVDHVNQRPSPNPPDAAHLLPVIPTEFEVAQVKPSLAGAPEGGGVMPGGRIDMLGNTMKDFIKFAWNIDDRDDDTLIGGPKWLDADRFDIVAKASTTQLPTGQLVDVDTLRPMMKALLIDRFQLQTHTGEEPIDVYALEAVKRGARLTKTAPSRRSNCRNTVEMGAPASPLLTRHFECHNTTMGQFADVLRTLDSGYIDHPVIDATNLPGAYDFALSYSPRRAYRAAAKATGDPTGAISLAEALDKQLGLQLKLQKRRMPVLIIDHVNQKPTDN